MQTVDIIFLVLLLFGAYRGFQKGLLLELVALSSIFISVIFSMKFMPLVSKYIAQLFPSLGASLPLVSFIVVFVLLLVLLNFIGKSLKKILDLTLLGSLDDILGLVVGVLKIALGLSFIIWVYNNVLGELPDQWVGGSLIFPYIQMLAPKLIEYLSFLFPYMEDIKEKIKDISLPDTQQVLLHYNDKLCLQSIV